MVSACLAWPGLHIAFAKASKQPQMRSDSWHAVLQECKPSSVCKDLVELVLNGEPEITHKHTVPRPGSATGAHRGTRPSLSGLQTCREGNIPGLSFSQDD